MTTNITERDHPYKEQAHLWNATFTPPPLADPDEPLRVIRTALEKIELGKSSSSCKVALITRLHRKTALQEFWCASFEEAQVYLSLAAHPDVVNFKEQLTRVHFIKEDGEPSHTLVDAHVLLRDGTETLVSVKYHEKANRQSYKDEVADIASQCSRDIADRFIVVSRYSFHPTCRSCANEIHKARRGWDPQADQIVLEAANDLGERFSFKDLVDHSKLKGRGHRAAIRLIGDSDIGKDLLDPIADDTELWRAAA
jgi:hypothetical protein